MFADKETNERRQIAAERQLRLAKRNWQITGRVLACLALAFIALVLYQTGYVSGWRDGSQSAEHATP